MTEYHFACRVGSLADGRNLYDVVTRHGELIAERLTHDQVCDLLQEVPGAVVQFWDDVDWAAIGWLYIRHPENMASAQGADPATKPRLRPR